jgi:hypothetical protein
MKVRILKNITRVVNGQVMGPFTAGEEVDLDQQRAELFIGSAMAEAVQEPAPEPTEKADSAADEADREPARSRKSRGG